MRILDATDARILLALDADPDATVVALADRLTMSRNTVQARLRRMRDSGALGAYSRRLDPAALGYPLMAFMTLSLSQREGDRAAQQLARIPEVVEILATTGDGDLLVRVVARDTADLYRITNQIVANPSVVRTSTSIVLHEVAPSSLDRLLHRHTTTPDPA
ncbi:Lrp/AsnC family transcriptional regulator [Actinoplanes sp. NPDC049596]|uniref:Lrp/AsnC family transcriptional regulator n=1 Tax=unclassified Actinoplanes TaxID=2626549 RepID=UPI003429A0F3